MFSLSLDRGALLRADERPLPPQVGTERMGSKQIRRCRLHKGKNENLCTYARILTNSKYNRVAETKFAEGVLTL